MDEQIIPEIEKDTFFKRLKRGFKVLLDKAKETGGYLQRNNESQEANDFFDTEITKPIKSNENEKTNSKVKQDKDPFDIDFNNMTKCDF